VLRALPPNHRIVLALRDVAWDRPVSDAQPPPPHVALALLHAAHVPRLGGAVADANAVVLDLARASLDPAGRSDVPPLPPRGTVMTLAHPPPHDLGRASPGEPAPLAVVRAQPPLPREPAAAVDLAPGKELVRAVAGADAALLGLLCASQHGAPAEGGAVSDANAPLVRHILAPVRRALLACTRLVDAVVLFAVVFVVMVGGECEGGGGDLDLIDTLAHVLETRGPIGDEVPKLGLEGRGVGLEPSEGGASVDVDVVVVDVVTVVGQG